MNRAPSSPLPHIVVIGAGFGGLNFAKHFPEGLARITILDRQNHHVFQPLLYQVATAALSAVDISQPVRALFGDRPNLEVIMTEVTGIDLGAKKVFHRRGELAYDYLVLAAGARTSYFGRNEWEQFAPGLKTLDDALRVRRMILCSLEQAETEPDREKQAAATTIVVVGGGPTGVELAGAFAELVRYIVRRDFDHIDPDQVKVILVQGGQRVLPTFHETLSASAQEQLEKRGVYVRTGARVEAIRPGEVVVAGETIRSDNIIWAAGVEAVPLTKQLGVPVDRGGRIQVLPDLSVPGHPQAFAIGDIVTLKDANGIEVPGVAQGALQMGQHVAGLIREELEGNPLAPVGRKAFAYRDKGSMATIGRSAAVAEMKRWKLTGFPAWIAWLAVHLLFLIGFRNKFSVLVQWMYSYITFKRGARIITGVSGERSASAA